MEITVELRDMFSYSLIWILLLVLFLIIAIYLIIIIVKEKRKQKRKLVVVMPKEKDRDAIKNKYINILDNLLVNVNENKISIRDCYQTLSITIRNFIYEMTNIRVNNYTLTDIKKINMPVLSKLVEEYYDPEFAKESKGDTITSIKKTKEVIEKWN